MSKFDDAIAAAKAAHFDQPEMVQLIELIVAQNERVKNLEHFQLEAKARMTATETAVSEHAQSIGSLTKSRDEHETRVKAIEAKPDQDTKRLDEVEKRVTVVEGAVGSKAYRKVEKAGEPDPLRPAQPTLAERIAHPFETHKPDQSVPA
jgi:chromosome segregation ATPase